MIRQILAVNPFQTTNPKAVKVICEQISADLKEGGSQPKSEVFVWKLLE